MKNTVTTRLVPFPSRKLLVVFCTVSALLSAPSVHSAQTLSETQGDLEWHYQLDQGVTIVTGVKSESGNHVTLYAVWAVGASH